MPSSKTTRPRTSKDGGLRRVRYFRASDREYAYIQELAMEHKYVQRRQDGSMVPNVSELIRSCILCDMDPDWEPAA